MRETWAQFVHCTICPVSRRSERVPRISRSRHLFAVAYINIEEPLFRNSFPYAREEAGVLRRSRQSLLLSVYATGT